MLDTFVELPVKPGGFMESQSGVQRRNPKVFARLMSGEGATKQSAVFVLIHPTSNFHSHYLAAPLSERGFHVFMINTRYVANDTMLLMERAIQDLGAGIRYLRENGFQNIVLIGNSGGGALAAFYQQQAEHVTITSTPDGMPFTLDPEDVPPVDKLALVCAHPGRAEQLLCKIDPAIIKENDPLTRIANLDMYAPRHTSPYDATWLEQYRKAQKDRLRRIVHWVEARLELLNNERPAAAADEAFIIHGTQADPRLLDLTLDPNDRTVGTIQGNAQVTNLASNGLARFCTLRSFLSQWSPWHTRADGPTCLGDTTVPVLIVNHTADQTVFPSQVRRWASAAGERATLHDLVGAPHYLDDKPELLDELCNTLASWAS